MTATPQVGKTYRIASSRKGVFTARLTHVSTDGVWATGIITTGRAGAMLAVNERETGEEITVRIDLCTFTPAEPTKAEPTKTIVFTHHSRNKRSFTHAGRHFMAVRCDTRRPWVIDEINQAEAEGSQTIQRVPGLHKTRLIAAAAINHVRDTTP